MSEGLVFLPPRRRGRNTLILLMPIPAVLAAMALFQAIQLPPSLTSSIYLLISVALAAIIPWLVYRLYALSRARYILERDGMRIQWGLRFEDIPMTDILWVRLASESESKLSLPLLRMPGAVLGTRTSPDLGKIEYLASETHNLVLVASIGRVYAISPEDPHAFLDAFQELVEMGSLTTIAPLSLHPTSLLRRVWQDPLARLLTGASLILGLGLILWVASLAPSSVEISVGFLGPGIPRPPTSPVRLILLPVVSTTFLIVDWTLGVIFYRQDDTRPMAYLLWVAGIITSGMFLAVIYLISRS